MSRNIVFWPVSTPYTTNVLHTTRQLNKFRTSPDLGKNIMEAPKMTLIYWEMYRICLLRFFVRQWCIKELEIWQSPTGLAIGPNATIMNFYFWSLPGFGIIWASGRMPSSYDAKTNRTSYLLSRYQSRITFEWFKQTQRQFDVQNATFPNVSPSNFSVCQYSEWICSEFAGYCTLPGIIWTNKLPKDHLKFTPSREGREMCTSPFLILFGHTIKASTY